MGYRREQTFMPTSTRQATQGLDFGVDYGDALQLKLSRRTTLSLTIGAGAAKSLFRNHAVPGARKRDAGPLDGPDVDDQRELRTHP